MAKRKTRVSPGSAAARLARWRWHRNPVRGAGAGPLYRLADGDVVTKAQLRRMYMGRIPGPTHRRLLGITVVKKNPLGRCSICGRPHVDPMTLNSWPIDKAKCYQAETGGDPRCRARKGKKRRNPLGGRHVAASRKRQMARALHLMAVNEKSGSSRILPRLYRSERRLLRAGVPRRVWARKLTKALRKSDARCRRNPASVYDSLRRALAAKGFRTFIMRETTADDTDPQIDLGNSLSLSLDNSGWPCGVVKITKKPEWTMVDRYWHDDPSSAEIANRVVAFAAKHGVKRNPIGGRRAAKARGRIRARVKRVWRAVRRHGATSFSAYPAFGRRSMKTLRLAGRTKALRRVRRNPIGGRRAARSRARIVSRATLRARINKASGGARNAVMRSILAQYMAGRVKIRGARISAAVKRGIRRGRRGRR
jgi:hypothetical protein